MTKAEVVGIQVCGVKHAESLKEAVELLVKGGYSSLAYKLNFTVKLANGTLRTITIRDDEGETVAYGDFEGLPSFLDYAREIYHS